MSQNGHMLMLLVLVAGVNGAPPLNGSVKYTDAGGNSFNLIFKSTHTGISRPSHVFDNYELCPESTIHEGWGDYLLKMMPASGIFLSISSLMFITYQSATYFRKRQKKRVAPRRNPPAVPSRPAEQAMKLLNAGRST